MTLRNEYGENTEIQIEYSCRFRVITLGESKRRVESLDGSGKELVWGSSSSSLSMSLPEAAKGIHVRRPVNLI